jgi:nitrate/nitrite transporter NarK
MTMVIGGPQVGTAGGIMNAGGNVGGFLSPVLTPLVAKYFGWSWGLNTGCAMLVLGALACWFVDASEESPRIAITTPSGTASVPLG